MQSRQYGKVLIYLRPISRLTKLAFLTARATLKKNIIKIPWKDFKTSYIYVFFYKHCLGLNRRTQTVVSRNDMGRLSLNLNIYSVILKLWIHLENLPKNSIATETVSQTLNSTSRYQKTQSFMNSVIEILQLYGFADRK